MTAEQTTDQAPGRGLYVYGIMSDDIELTNEITGVGDPAGKVGLVRHNGLAALVSEIDLGRPLGTPEDLARHQEILDASASAVPILPMRFGAVVTGVDGITGELLDGGHDQFLAALDELGEHREYLVRARYDQAAILQEILAENDEAADLADQIRGADPDALREQRIRLGEIVGTEITAKRDADTAAFVEQMKGHCAASAVREPTDELDALSVAFLAAPGQEEEIKRVAEELAARAPGRMEVQVFGPMAAWDFVRMPGGEG